MSRTLGARNDPARAARVLTEKAFRHGIKLTHGQIDTLDAMATGAYKPRNAVAVLGAIRTKMEYAYSKPKQETELSGNVVISVSSPLPGPPGSARLLPTPQHLALEAAGNSAADQQGPGICDYVTSATSSSILTNEPEPIVDPEPPMALSPMATPSIIEAGKLVATDDQHLTAEQRREAERDAWLADEAIHPTDNRCDEPEGDA